MLSVYTHHYPPCKHTDIYHRHCRCPKWIQGTLDDGRIIRQAANTRNWEKAELTARDLEDAANPHRPDARTRVTIADAIQCFRDDEKSRHLSKDSNRKSTFFFETQLKTWAEKQGFVYLNQLTAAELTKFRGQWGIGQQTTRRKHELLL